MSVKKPIVIGQKFGKLTILEELDPIPFTKSSGEISQHRIILCKCDCGEITTKKYYDLRNGHTKSCGCLYSETSKDNNKKHGYAKYKGFYGSYKQMVSRCTNIKNEAYLNYGGRGIKICDKWLESIEFFAIDMFSTWQEGLTIERINVNGNYCKENCKWISLADQMRNKRNNTYVLVDNVKMSLLDAANKFYIKRHNLYMRLYRHGKTIINNSIITLIKPDKFPCVTAKNH